MSSFVDRLFTEPRDHDPLGVHRKRAEAGDAARVVALLQQLLVAQQKMQASLEQEMRALRGGVEALRREVAALRGEVVLAGLDRRVRRIEAHLNLPPTA